MKNIIIIVACVTLMSVPAYGQIEDVVVEKDTSINSISRIGAFYVGMGTGLSIENFRGDWGDLDMSWKLGKNYQAKFGVRPHENLAFEVSGEYVFHFKANKTDDFGNDIEAKVNIWNITANGKAMLPLSPDIDIYGILGIGYAGVEQELEADGCNVINKTENDFWGRSGIGIQIKLTTIFAVEAEANYNMGLGDIDDFAYYSGWLNILAFL